MPHKSEKKLETNGTYVGNVGFYDLIVFMVVLGQFNALASK